MNAPTHTHSRASRSSRSRSPERGESETGFDTIARALLADGWTRDELAGLRADPLTWRTVRAVRRTLELERGELAALLGVAWRTVARWERRTRADERPPSRCGGAARVALLLLAARPEGALDTLRELEPREQTEPDTPTDDETEP